MEPPNPAQSDAGGAITDSMNPAAVPQGDKGAGTANLVGEGPIAYGAILADGTKYSGTPNWTSTYNATYQRYEIAITGESYYGRELWLGGRRGSPRRAGDAHTHASAHCQG